MSTLPRVSIGMPVYNGEAHIREAIDSILRQSYDDFELVICDNASTDGTEDICRACVARDERVHYHRNEANLGAAANFNKVFELSRGHYFKWFAHDDYLAPTYLERCVEVLDAEGQEVILVFPQRVEVYWEGEVRGPDKRVSWYEAAPPYDRIGFARSMLIPDRRFPTLVFGLMPAEVLRKTRLIGAYHCADLVLLTELRMLGTFRHLPEPLFFNRLHERRSVSEEAAWYDPGNAARLRRPARRLLHERLVGVWRTDAGFLAKLYCCLCVIVLGQFVARTPPVVGGWLLSIAAGIFRAWERLTLWAVRESRQSFIGHRAWMLFAGLRRRNSATIKIALGSATTPNRDALCRFVATRLGRRRDAGARELLNEWRRGTCPNRRAAAESVLGRESEDRGRQSADENSVATV